MAEVVGILLDKDGNVQPNTLVIARQESLDPAGDMGSGTTDAIGVYRITVANTATLYNLYVVSEEGGSTGPNFSGIAFSSGNAVSSFVLLDDADFGIEHHINPSGDAGEHSSTTHDDITLRTGAAFLETTDAWFEMRIGATANTLRIEADAGNSVYWVNPRYGSGSSNYDFGLRQGYGSDPSYFYLGTAKTYWLKTDGSFYLSAGTIVSDVTASGDWTLAGDWTFDEIPQVSAYVAPTLDTQLAAKKYVDDSIADFGATGINWRAPAQVLKMTDDSDYSGAPPPCPVTGDAYVANNWGVGYTDDHVYEWDGASWVDVGAITDDFKVIITDSGAAGSFATHENDEAVYSTITSTWTFTSPSDGWAIFIIGDGSYYEDNGYLYNTDDTAWNLISGPGSIVAGDALTKTGNLLDVNVDDDTIQVNGSNQLETKLIKPDRVSAGSFPTPAVGEMKTFYHTGTSKVYAVYNDPVAGVVSVEMA